MVARTKKVIQIIPPSGRRIYLPKDPKYQSKFYNLCVRLNKKPTDTIKYLIDVEEISIQTEDIEKNAPKIADAIINFLDEVNRINPRAHDVLLKNLQLKGVPGSWRT